MIYLPPGYDQEQDRRYPSIYVIQGFTGQVDMWRAHTPFRRNFPELADELFAEGETPRCVLVFVDAWTSLGGSQFLDSPAVGRYHTYLCDEVVPWVDANYQTLPAREHRGISGKSSGGYGAMVSAMLRPDLFSGFATHAGDALFEVCYPRDFQPAVRALRDHYDGSFDEFWADFRARVPMTKEHDGALVEVYAMAACYSADEDGMIHFPFDLSTGRMDPEVWERWLRWDPVRMAPERADALRSMRAIYVDAGRSDEYFLDLGAEAFSREVEAVGAPDLTFELFDAGHCAIEYRYPRGLAYLAERLSAPPG